MARYYNRGGGRRWNRSGRYYGRNYGYRRSGYRGKGQYKSAKQQADNASVVLNIPTQISCFNKRVNLGTEQNPDMIEAGIYAMNIYDLMRKSEFYQSYSRMYDEFKIDNVKIKLIPVAFDVTAGTNNTRYQALTVYTAWDRTGLSQEQVKLVADNVAGNPDKIGSYAQGDRDGLYTTIGSNITTYSSSESRQVQPGASTTITRWLAPKTMNEKSSWLSTSVIDKWCDGWDLNNGRYVGIPTNSGLADYSIAKIGITGTGVTGSVSAISWSPALKENPCFLCECPEIKFKPTFLVGVYPSVEDAITEAGNMPNNNKVLFNVETEVLCTFRGLRKAQIVS